MRLLLRSYLSSRVTLASVMASLPGQSALAARLPPDPAGPVRHRAEPADQQCCKNSSQPLSTPAAQRTRIAARRILAATWHAIGKGAVHREEDLDLGPDK